MEYTFSADKTKLIDDVMWWEGRVSTLIEADSTPEAWEKARIKFAEYESIHPDIKIKNIGYREGDYTTEKISLVEYAKLHNKADRTVRQKALRGGFKTAVKVGRDWIIDKDEPYEDLRRK